MSALAQYFGEFAPYVVTGVATGLLTWANVDYSVLIPVISKITGASETSSESLFIADTIIPAASFLLTSMLITDRLPTDPTMLAGVAVGSLAYGYIRGYSAWTYPDLGKVLNYLVNPHQLIIAVPNALLSGGLMYGAVYAAGKV